MTQLIVHIGEHKTGSTTIQDFMCRNSATLMRRSPKGILYPQSGLLNTAHHHLAYAVKPEISNLAAGRTLGDPAFKKAWQSLRKEIGSSDASLTVLSSETFENNCAQHLHQTINENLQGLASSCRIVLYIRPLIELLISRYSQLTAFEDFSLGFDTFSQRCLTHPNLFWSQRLVAWFEAFGETNVAARGYIQNRLTKQDVIEDFCEHVLSLAPDEMVIPDRRNARHNAVVLAAMKRLRETINGDSYHGPLRYQNARHRNLLLSAVLAVYEHRKETFYFSRTTIDRMHKRYLPDARALDRMLYAGQPVFSEELDKAVELAKDREGLLDLADYLGLDSAGTAAVVQQLIEAAEKSLQSSKHKERPRAASMPPSPGDGTTLH